MKIIPSTLTACFWFCPCHLVIGMLNFWAVGGWEDGEEVDYKLFKRCVAMCDRVFYLCTATSSLQKGWAGPYSDGRGWISPMRTKGCFSRNLHLFFFFFFERKKERRKCWWNVPWVPEVFLACGGNFRCRPKADTSSSAGRSQERRSSSEMNWRNSPRTYWTI